jgi:hypothetical protein
MIKDLYEIARDANLGFWGFVSLVLVVVMGLGLKRAADFAKGLNGQWRELIDEGNKIRGQLHDELEMAQRLIARQRVTIETQHAEMEILRAELNSATIHVARLRALLDKDDDAHE